MDAEGILGPISHPWKIVTRFLRYGYGSANLNPCTGGTMEDDPRLGLLHPEWECLEIEARFKNGFCGLQVRNKVTGQVAMSDPRLLPDALSARGLNLMTFDLD